jgi:hypothetical protein
MGMDNRGWRGSNGQDKDSLSEIIRAIREIRGSIFFLSAMPT